MAKNLVARWETRGKDFLDLTKGETANSYWYNGNGCGGGFSANSDEEAIERMEAPWGDSRGVGQATVLKSDRSSLKRVI